jgi:hypothetical protein
MPAGARLLTGTVASAQHAAILGNTPACFVNVRTGRGAPYFLSHALQEMAAGREIAASAPD